MRHKTFWVVLMLALLLPWAAVAETVVANHVPWSGYWWPKRFGGLLTGSDYKGRPSPLDKYEALDLISGSRAKQAYGPKYHKPEGLSWAGMCYEWALAASIEPEPTRVGVIDNVPFMIGDKKGLLALAHSQDVVTIGRGSDPVVFHSWLKEKLKGQGRIFVADLDPGLEVWSYPIYKYTMTEQVAGSQIRVACTVYYPDDFVHPDFVGLDLRLKSYTYTLMRDGAGNIVDGYWTGDSIEDHPDLLTFHVATKPEETFLDPELLSRIMNSRDPLQGITTMSPGSYPLAVYEPRSFTLAVPDTTQNVLITVHKSQRTDQISVKLIGQGGVQTVLELDGRDSAQFFGAPNLAQRLEILPQSTQNSGICTVVMDVVAEPMSCAPYLVHRDAWMGVAQTATSAGSGGMLVGRGLEGDPVLTYKGDEKFVVGAKRSFILDQGHDQYKMGSLPVGLDAFAGSGGLKSIVLAGGEENMLAAYGQGTRGRRLISPGIVLQNAGYSQYQPSLRNHGLESNSVHIRSYSNTGQLNDETTITLDPRETRLFSLGNSPLYRTSMNDWLLLEAEADIEMLGTARSRTKPALGENFYAATVEAQEFFIPHAPVQSGWDTWVTLINPTASSAVVVLTSQMTGAELGRLTVPAKGRKETSLKAFTSVQTLGREVLRVHSSQAIVGYVSYMANDDAATLPLLTASDTQTRLVVPHCPNTAPWWTGVALGNISQRSQRVHVQAYDSKGNVLPTAQATIDIQARGTRSVMTAGLIGGSFTQAGSLVFTCDEPEALMGFYLIGNNAQTMLTGYNF